MKIAIEAQRIFRKEKHGMDYVALETIRELQKIDQQNEYFILVSPGDDVCLQESANMHIVTVNWPSYPLWEQIGLPLALKKIKPDLLHCTSNTAPVHGNIPLVLTLHDIIFLEKKQGKNQSMYQRLGRFYRKIIVPQILTKCKRIITVSHFECNRISHFLHIDKQLLVAVYNGYSQHFIPIRNAQAITARYIKNHPYLFFLGNTDPKKNTARVLQAYRIYLKKSSQPLPLLIADLKEEIIDEYLNREGLQEIKKMLYHPGYIPNTELPAVYSGASVFIYTSLRESFGIPILEAMACGTPVITSTTSAMPEIAGPEGILVNPFEPEEIASALLHLEENAEFYQSQTAYGLERVRRFSWENTAREILNIYLLAELNYKRFMYKKLCILLIFSKLKVAKLLIDKYRMHNLYAIFAKLLNICKHIAGNLVNESGNVPRRGVVPKFSDLEVVALNMASEAVGIDSESLLFAKLQEYRVEIPNLISRRQYNDRRKITSSLCNAIRERMVSEMDGGEGYFCIDSKPIEVCRIARSKRCSMGKKDFKKAPSVGYCASQSMYYYGYKLHAVCGLSGVIHSFDLTKASVHDIHYLKDVKVDYSNCTVIGDRGYISAQVQLDLFETANIRLEVPYRCNQKEWKPTFPAFAKARKRIETLFSQLCDQFMIIRNYAKDTDGLFARIIGKISALTILQYINYKNEKPIGRVKYALF